MNHDRYISAGREWYQLVWWGRRLRFCWGWWPRGGWHHHFFGPLFWSIWLGPVEFRYYRRMS